MTPRASRLLSTPWRSRRAKKRGRLTPPLDRSKIAHFAAFGHQASTLRSRSRSARGRTCPSRSRSSRPRSARRRCAAAIRACPSRPPPRARRRRRYAGRPRKLPREWPRRRPAMRAPLAGAGPRVWSIPLSSTNARRGMRLPPPSSASREAARRATPTGDSRWEAGGGRSSAALACPPRRSGSRPTAPRRACPPRRRCPAPGFGHRPRRRLPTWRRTACVRTSSLTGARAWG